MPFFLSVNWYLLLICLDEGIAFMRRLDSEVTRQKFELLSAFDGGVLLGLKWEDLPILFEI